MAEGNDRPNAAITGAAQEQELVITRVVAAPRALVWQAWTDPRHVARWWGPHGFTNPVCEWDPRPGGALRIDMTGPDGAVSPCMGVFHEVVAPERLVFTTRALEDADGNVLLEVLNTVTFADVGDKTHVTLRAVVVTATPGAASALAEMEDGWTQTLDRLAEHLATA